MWLDPLTYDVWPACQTVGERRVPAADVEAGLGLVGAPLLLQPQVTDLFEHNSDFGTPADLDGQDHAYDIALKGDIAFVADGSNGLTAYDVTRDPTDMLSGFFVGNIGNDQDRPGLGRATGVTLFEDGSTTYAFVAAGPRGVGVIDVTDPAHMAYVKVFEPIKIEDGKVGHADGRGVDVAVIGDHALFAYDSFGMVMYSIADLIEPAPKGIDPQELWSKQGGTVLYDHRPEAVHRFKLSEQKGYEEAGGGALNFTWYTANGRTIVLAAYGTAGLARIDWTDPAAPALIGLANTVGEAQDVTLANGWVYVADGSGGLAVLY